MGADVGGGSASKAVCRSGALETVSSSSQGVASSALSADVGRSSASKAVGLLRAVKAGVAGGERETSITLGAGVSCVGASLAVCRSGALETVSSSCQGVASRTLSTDIGRVRTC